MKIGIRREDKNVWERRAPLTPDHVKTLSTHGLQVFVQPSAIRVFQDDEYRAAGATVQEDLTGCAVVFAVKEIPSEFFAPHGVYVFFSHTFKGQPYNMRMLRRILDLKATLIDYEKVTDEENRRLIFFGNYAGTAGMLETLYTLGKRLEWEGTPNPLATLKRPTEYFSLEEAKEAVRAAGRQIAVEGLPESVSPLVIGFTGYGNVSRGAQEIYDLLPHESVSPLDLIQHMRSGDLSARTLYKVIFEERHMVRPSQEGYRFDLQDYYAHPEKYESRFEDYLPHLSVLMNCIYWDARYPRIVTKEWVRRSWAGGLTPKLKVIGDISCDIEGSVECTVRATEPGDPIYTYVASDGATAEGWTGNGPVIMAVDTLPSELPREASTSFGEMVMPFVMDIAGATFEAGYEDLRLPPAIRRAVIVRGGQFTPTYQYMKKYVQGY